MSRDRAVTNDNQSPAAIFANALALQAVASNDPRQIAITAA